MSGSLRKKNPVLEKEFGGENRISSKFGPCENPETVSLSR
jgi:hypothetical protein